MVDNSNQQAGANDASIALRKAQQKKTRLRKEAELAAEEEEEKIQQKAKLTATLTRVEQLKAQKAEREAQQGTTTLLIIGGPQSQSGSTPQQSERPLVSVEFFERYPAINEIHFKAIKENTFKPINVAKLMTEMVLNRNKVKLLAVGSNIAVEAKEEDALLGKLKELSHLIQCFLIYTNIFVHFTPEPLQQSLWIGMLTYVKQLWSFSSTSTFESVQQYHFLFHSMRIRRGIDNGALWGQSDSSLERKVLRQKPQPDYTPKSCFSSNTYAHQPQAIIGTHPVGGQPSHLGQYFLPTCH